MTDPCRAAFEAAFPTSVNQNDRVRWRAFKAGWDAASLCMCKDRPLSKCPGEWEPGCGLWANEKYAIPSPRERNDL